MKIIYKYPLIIEDTQKISIPESGEILCLQVQNNIPCIWVLINDFDNVHKVKEYTINIYGTGQRFKENGFCQYIGTFQLVDGEIIFHVFMELDI